MGICDLIPGISGGTIAFITGIYPRLINAVKAISLRLFYNFFKYLFHRNKNNLKELKKDIKKLDIMFLVTLVLGILTAILIGSRIIKFLLDNYFAYTLSFFIGLILASAKIIFDNIQDHRRKNVLFGFIGLIVGLLLIILVPVNIANPSLRYIFIGGFFAISAMFLPGISGAFILLIMGLYEFIIGILNNPISNIKPLLIFMVGVVLGAFVISRIISFLFEKDKAKTLYLLLGLVVGALSIPVKKIFQNNLGVLDYSVMIICFVLGILLVKISKDYAKQKKK
jgi:putative membrane protein